MPGFNGQGRYPALGQRRGADDHPWKLPLKGRGIQRPLRSHAADHRRLGAKHAICDLHRSAPGHNRSVEIDFLF